MALKTYVNMCIPHTYAHTYVHTRTTTSIAVTMETVYTE